ncbi:MAG: methyltransferase [Candidatus Kapabacteria bacterium]|nr:methyltransferase [Candidatus Kapabacteria bacterium]
MRIIGGTLKRTIIPSPPGDATRPTMDQLRESIFTVIEQTVDLAGSTVLDLYAGSGILSWEALSRGATRTTMVDTSAEICRHLRSIAQQLGRNEDVKIIRTDALSAIEGLQLTEIDCLFADPPYARRDCNRLMQLLNTHDVIRPGGLAIIEHGDQEFLLPTERFEPVWQGARGPSIVEIFRRIETNP